MITVEHGLSRCVLYYWYNHIDEPSYYTKDGILNIRNEKYAKDQQPIDKRCSCPVCKNYSRAYLRHLFQSKEMLSMRLAVMHNLYFYNHMMEEIRSALDTDTFENYRRTYSNVLDSRI